MKNSLESYQDELQMRISSNTSEAKMDIKKDPKQIFVIHGHDTTAVLELEKLLGEEWDLKRVILKYKPGKGRTLIEKFEEEAKTTSYAFAILP